MSFPRLTPLQFVTRYRVLVGFGKAPRKVEMGLRRLEKWARGRRG